GVRDGHVTGVQTCALPICIRDAMFPTLVVVYGAQWYKETCARDSIDRRNDHVLPATVIVRLFGTFAHHPAECIVQPELRMSTDGVGNPDEVRARHYDGTAGRALQVLPKRSFGFHVDRNCQIPRIASTVGIHDERHDRDRRGQAYTHDRVAAALCHHTSNR